MTPAADGSAAPSRESLIIAALKRHRTRLLRKLEAMRGDLAEAERAPEFRRFAEALLSYIREVPPRAASVTLPDPHEHGATITIALDPNLNAQGNAQRYFRRAAKG